MNRGSSSNTKLNKKTFVQFKLHFPETTRPTASKEKGKCVSHRSVVPEKRKDSDEKHVYCYYCDMGKSITLYRPNNSDHLLTHINTALHTNNKVEADKRVNKKLRTTFISQYVTDDDNYNSDYDANDLQCKDNSNSQYKDCKWLDMNFNQLNQVVINTIKYRSGSTTSDALKNLLNYISLELKNNSYHLLVKSYPALGQIIEAVEANGLKDWIERCTTFMINKTMDEQQPVFVGMARAVTKVLDKIEYEVTSIRGIRQYNESFVDFLIRLAYDYYGPTICAKDQIKVAEMIEFCRTQQQWVGSVPIDNSMVPHSMTTEELHTKISSFNKATYITVFALSAILPDILPLVLAIISSNQKETKSDVFFKNNTILKELIKSNAKPIGLYFNDAAHDQAWIEETYNKNSLVYNDLGIIMINMLIITDDKTFFSRKFPIEINLSDNGQPLINGTDIFHCIKKAEHLWYLWYLKELYESKSSLTNEVLNPKDKQTDKLAERFFSSN
ncbi:6412_t:CDS:2, partial [Funneliformis geosporum]